MPEENLTGTAADAYYAVFKHLVSWYCRDNPSEGTILAVDLTNAIINDTESLLIMLQDYCIRYRCTLLLDNFDGLVEKGYIETWEGSPVGFMDGFYIAFNDAQLSDSILVTSAHIYKGNLAAYGANFTVELKQDAWELELPNHFWVS
jgi:hypothetical protein